MANPVGIQQELLTLIGRPGDNSSINLAASVPPAIGLGPATPDSRVNPSADDSIGTLSRELEALRRQLGASEETSKRTSRPSASR